MAKKWLPFRSVLYLWHNAKSYYALLTHKSTPLYIKGLVGAALVYLISPFDLIPDWLAVFGIVDDIAIVSLIISFAVKLAQTSKKNAEPSEKNE